MTDITHLYGVNKAGANIVDLQPVQTMILQDRQFNKRRNAEKQAKRAVMAAGISSQLDKLKNTAWSKDQQYVSDLMNDTQSWLADTYASHPQGEMAAVDDPSVKREFDERVNFIKRQNDASHANIQMGDSMLKQRMKNLDDIDEQSAQQFDQWLALPPEERLQTPMPLIKDRDLDLSEVVQRDLKVEAEKLSVPIGYTGTRDEATGRTVTVKGKQIPKEKYDKLIDSVNKNPNSSTFKYANREAVGMINEDVIPPNIQNENGEMIPNPDYIKELNETRKSLIQEQIDALIPAEYKTTSASYSAVKEAKERPEDKPLTPLSKEESGVKVTKDIPVTKASGDKSKVFSESYTGDDGNTYKKTAVKVYKTEDGGMTTDPKKAKNLKDFIPSGTLLNAKTGNLIPEDVEATKDTEVKIFKSGTTYPVVHTEKADLTSIDHAIDDEGKSITPSQSEGFSNAVVNSFTKDVEYKKEGDDYIFKGDKGYEKSKSKTQKSDFIKVKVANPSGKGSKFRTIPYNKEAKIRYPILAKKVEELELKGLNKSEENGFIDIN